MPETDPGDQAPPYYAYPHHVQLDPMSAGPVACGCGEPAAVQAHIWPKWTSSRRYALSTVVPLCARHYAAYQAQRERQVQAACMQELEEGRYVWARQRALVIVL